MLFQVNRKFDLKVGQKIRALGPMSADETDKDFTYKIYKVTKIYPHIFLAVTQQAEDSVAERCFRKCDYVCGFINRV